MVIDTVLMGRRVAARRTLYGLTQMELAKCANVTQGTVALFERGHLQRVSVETVARIALALGLSLDYLVDGKGGAPEERLPGATSVGAV